MSARQEQGSEATGGKKRSTTLVWVCAVVLVLCAALALDAGLRATRPEAAVGGSAEDASEQAASVGDSDPAPDAADPDAPSTGSEAAPEANATAPASPDPSTVLAPDGTPLPDTLPFVGMDAALIDESWLGAHDRVRDVVGGSGRYRGATPYVWLAQNGTQDEVFTAYVKDGKVVGVLRNNQGTDYWKVPGQILPRDLPDRGASGETVPGNVVTKPGVPYDPLDYKDPDSFAEDTWEYFKEQGYEDPYDAAVVYWEKNAA